MKGDKLKGQIKACESIVANRGCVGSAVWCLTSKTGKGMFPCPARGMSEAAKDKMEWDCRKEVASARAFLDRHASPVTPDRETIQGPRFDTTREKSKEEKE